MISQFIIFVLTIGVRFASAGIALNNVNWLGRFDNTNGTYKADWPFSGFNFQVLADAPTVKVSITFGSAGNADGYNYYVEESIDCKVRDKYLISSSTDSTSMLDITIDGTEVGKVHDLKFRKVTEAYQVDAYGVMEVVDIALAGGSALIGSRPLYNDAICGATNKKLLVIGDSISAAYGVDGSYPCTFEAALENVHHGWAGITADELQVDTQITAWSGKGVVRNYGDENQVSTNPMPTYYNRTRGMTPAPASADDSNYWDPSRFPADVVVVMLGSNDYSTDPTPTDEQFTSGLIDFLGVIRTDYPSASASRSVCTFRSRARSAPISKRPAQAASATYVFVDPDVYNGGYGCDYHPSATAQQFIADILAPNIKVLLEGSG